VVEDNSPEQELLKTVADLPLDSHLPKAPSNDWFGRVVDRVGPIAPWTSAGVVVIVFLVATIGGPDWVWVGNFYLIPLILLLLYIPWLFRRNRREQIDKELRRRQKQATARTEVARMVLEEREKAEGKNS
jgi:hypothetical protein